MAEGRRIGINTGHRVVYYDLDADGKVYWLRPRPDNHLQRYRVQDPELIQQLKTIAQANPEHNVGDSTDPK